MSPSMTACNPLIRHSTNVLKIVSRYDIILDVVKCCLLCVCVCVCVRVRVCVCVCVCFGITLQSISECVLTMFVILYSQQHSSH